MKDRLSGLNKKLKEKAGFTLIEILTVVMLIGILFVVFVPRISFSTEKVKMAGLEVDFRAYQVAFESVGQKYNGFTKFADIS